VIKQFKARYPQVHLALHQCSPREIAEMLAAGEADIGIATEGLALVPELITVPCYTWHHAVVVPKGHPLAAVPELTLEAIAEYPIVTYNEGFTGRAHIDSAFADAGLTVDIVLSAIDADVIKTYVEVGLGIGILASMAFNPAKDTELVMLNSDRLFADNTTRLAVRRGVYLRDYARHFIEAVAPGAEEVLKETQADSAT
jgi:LysR family cys regulon transcriptional activator